ncbi:hypothetical protein BBO99_00009143 [Phytophthora kernoviae]|uniref:Alpha/beta hydrolase fold-3 domain-containing protein n=2 Tax=Phytophthora kernoviae TaxID=325452 RepID=A0A3R7K103_9STRA|nr:hypothetical protein G195_010710 [Phytophthora kernoviae 00238/432]KAG2507414.1 hypothetical protein JM18_009279 [Phytophthora kernoviae]KAG2512978.1 hypothetical protein JM16_007980 [Phytophthora kernoviae]RLM96110.1 hypothetical protein BBI17_009161 [Phytophthora kernoviae]RLN73990.1 hypothetical protein BBO99_00009143 [Phytophthora kernoviae]
MKHVRNFVNGRAPGYHAAYTLPVFLTVTVLSLWANATHLQWLGLHHLVVLFKLVLLLLLHELLRPFCLSFRDVCTLSTHVVGAANTAILQFVQRGMRPKFPEWTLWYEWFQAIAFAAGQRNGGHIIKMPNALAMRRNFQLIGRFLGCIACWRHGNVIESFQHNELEHLWLRSKGANQGDKQKCIVVLYYHGGGYALFSPHFFVEFANRLLTQVKRQLSAGADTVTMDVQILLANYRKLPEVCFPAPLDDAMTMFDYLVNHEKVPPRRIILAGDSAGAGLALATLLRLRRARSESPMAAMVNCPFADLSADVAVSKHCFIAKPMLDAIKAFCVEETPQAYWREGAMLQTDLRGLPPMFIQAAEFDILHQQSLQLAKNARSDGVEVQLDVHAHMPHVFTLFPHFIMPQSSEGIQNMAGFIVRRLTAHRRPTIVQYVARGFKPKFPQWTLRFELLRGIMRDGADMFGERIIDKNHACVIRRQSELFGSFQGWFARLQYGLRLETVEFNGLEHVWLKASPVENSSATNRLVLLFYHGGGYAVLSPRMYISFCSALAGAIKQELESQEGGNGANIDVFLANYRKLPEHQFPVPAEDAVTMYEYLLQHEGLEPSQIILAGDSAGGGLVMSTLLRVRDGESGSESKLPLPLAAIVACPLVDLTGDEDEKYVLPYARVGIQRMAVFAAKQWIGDLVADPRVPTKITRDCGKTTIVKTLVQYVNRGFKPEFPNWTLCYELSRGIMRDATNMFGERLFDERHAPILRRQSELLGSFQGWFARRQHNVLLETVQLNGLEHLWLKSRPVKASNSVANRVVVLYYHGGAYAVLCPRAYISFCSSLITAIKQEFASQAAGNDVIVDVFIANYRKVPEYQFPVPAEDAVTMYEYLLQHERLQPSQIVLAGDSAGGGLVLSTLLRVRDGKSSWKSKLPLPLAAIAVCPATDLSGNDDENEGQHCILSPSLTAACFRGYHPTIEDPSTWADASPVHCDLRGLPPVFVQTGSFDYVYQHSLRLMAKAKADGVTNWELDVHEGMPHVFTFHSSFVLPYVQVGFQRMAAFAVKQFLSTATMDKTIATATSSSKDAEITQKSFSVA